MVVCLRFFKKKILSTDFVELSIGKVYFKELNAGVLNPSLSTATIRSSEIKFLKKADSVFVTSHALYNYCSRYSNKVYTFPFAVNFQEFEKVRLNKENFLPGEFRDIKRPIVGYMTITGQCRKKNSLIQLRKWHHFLPQLPMAAKQAVTRRP